MICKDKAVTYLNDIGYDVIRLPREGIDPLLLLGRNGKLNRLGSLSDIISQGGTVPQITIDQQTANIKIDRTDKLGAGLGFKFLNDILSAMGVTGANLGLAYQHASRIEIVFENVLNDLVDLSKIAKYLGDATPDTTNPIIVDNFDEEGKAFVIVETLKSNSFGVVAYNQSGMSIDAEVANINGVLGINSKVNVSNDVAGKVSYKGEKLLRFGFKAAPIWVEVESGNARFRFRSPHFVGPLAMQPARRDELKPEILGRNTLHSLD